MKYVLEWRVRPGIGGMAAEADTRRAVELYSKWQPPVKMLQFVGRIGAEGGFMVCEADNPADILEGTAKERGEVAHVYKHHGDLAPLTGEDIVALLKQPRRQDWVDVGPERCLKSLPLNHPACMRLNDAASAPRSSS